MKNPSLKTLLQKSTLVIACLLMTAVVGQSQEKPKSQTAQKPSAAASYFPDTELMTQDGKTVRFYSDMLKGRVVLINVFFATCQGVCLPMNRNIAKLQEKLGPRVGTDVHLISISVDPTTDTPERLKTYATSIGARPGWTFLTGEKANVDLVLQKLGQYVDDKNSHLSIMIMGNERTGLWKKAFAMANVTELLKVAESVIDDTGKSN